MQERNFWQRLQAPGSPRHLGFVRIVVGLYVTSVFLSPVFSVLQGLNAPVSPRTASWVPSGVEHIVQEHLVGPLRVAGLIGALGMTLGLGTRVAVGVTLASTFLLFNFFYRVQFFHDEWPYLNVLLLVLFLSPCGDRWSIDSLLVGVRTQRNSNAYRWPIEIAIAWFALVYMAAGLAKLLPLEKGVVWLEGETLRSLFIQRYLDSPIHWWLGRPLFDYELLWPFTLMSWATVVVEVGAVGLLISSSSYFVILPGILGMHFSTYAMGVPGFFVIATAYISAFLPPRWFGDVREHTPDKEGAKREQEL